MINIKGQRQLPGISVVLKKHHDGDLNTRFVRNLTFMYEELIAIIGARNVGAWLAKKNRKFKGF